MKRISSIFMTACMMVSLVPVQVHAAENFHVIPTGIAADGVVNCEGYGCLTLYEAGRIFEDGTEVTPEHHGLINWDGTIIFPYSKGTSYYEVHDGIISYGSFGVYFDDFDETASMDFSKDFDNDYVTEHQTRYYDLNGNRLFEKLTLPETVPEWIDLTATDQGNPTHIALSGSSPMRGGYALVYLNYGVGAEAFIDKTGRVTCITSGLDDNFDSHNMSEGIGTGWFGDNGWIAYADYGQDLLLGYLDSSGQTVLDLRHLGLKTAYPFTDGLAVVQDQNDLYGAIDTNGNLIIPCIYQTLYTDSGEVLGAQMQDKWGYIDKNGQTIIPFMYDDVYGWDEGLGTVVLDGKCGLVNANNNIVLPLEYDDLSDFGNGVCYGIKDRQLYIIVR